MVLDAPLEVDRLLRLAVAQAASDLHLEPGAGGVVLKLRVDGLLETVGEVSVSDGRRLVNRLMVAAGLLTIASFAAVDGPVREALAAGAGEDEIDLRLRDQRDYQTLRESAAVRVTAGETDTAEVNRVLGTG